MPYERPNNFAQRQDFQNVFTAPRVFKYSRVFNLTAYSGMFVIRVVHSHLIHCDY